MAFFCQKQPVVPRAVQGMKDEKLVIKFHQAAQSLAISGKCGGNRGLARQTWRAAFWQFGTMAQNR